MYNRPTHLEINLDALKHNFNYLKSFSNKEVFAVVKANAYGHGMVGISKFFDTLNCAYLCVSSLDEALRLRNKEVISPILILGYTQLSQNVLEIVSKMNITLSITSMDWFLELMSYNASSLPINYHIEIDTGMNRLGIKNVNEIKNLLKISSNHNIGIEGVYTHFHSSDKNDCSTQNQFKKFKSILEILDYDFKWIHTSNSDAILNFNDTISNAIRPGLSLYGYSNSETQLIPIMHFFSQITQRKHIEENETVSYGATFRASESMWIGIVPVGYADGLPFGLSHNYNVYIEDIPCPIIGRICMDQLMIKIPNEITSNVVTISGLVNNFETMAKITNTITYEVLTCLNIRIHRIFRLNKEIFIEE